MEHSSDKLTFAGLAIVLSVWVVGAHTTAQGDATTIKVNGGSVTFEVSTNMFSTTVRGQSSAITGATRLLDSGSGLRLEQLEAVVPVGSLKTGIKIRDEHMRKYIFEAADGQVPDVRFSADTAECPQSSSGVYSCSASGALVIRGTSRPFAIELKVMRTGEAFHVTGDGKVLLSAYGIERPSQFGVRTDDEVKVHLDVNARNITTATARVR